jgi:hypothetical protein
MLRGTVNFASSPNPSPTGPVLVCYEFINKICDTIRRSRVSEDADSDSFDMATLFDGKAGFWKTGGEFNPSPVQSV